MMIKSRLGNTTVLALLLLLVPVPSGATDITLLVGLQHSDDFEIAENAANLSAEPGDDVSVDDGLALSLAVDFELENLPDSRIGFYLSHHSTEIDSAAGLDNPDLDITHLHFTAMNYYPNGKWAPFVLAGIGAGYFSPGDSSLKSSTRFSAQLATGANYTISDNLYLRLEARWLPTFFNTGSAGICSGGCTIALQSETYSQFQANIGLQYRF
ncbi:MAG: outer membrane beta-barrel protein [Halioglobus sp.]